MENQVIYDAKHARRVEWLWWIAAVFGVFFTILGIVNKSMFTVVTIAVIVGCVFAARRWRTMSVTIAGDDVVLRQFTRTERIPIDSITEVGVRLPQLGTHTEAVYVGTANRTRNATVTAFTKEHVSAEPLLEALESHGWEPPEPAPEPVAVGAAEPEAGTEPAAEPDPA
jgi:hypothetical protein